MLGTPAIPTLANPLMIDNAFAQIQTKLVAGLSWLDHAFGKAQRMKQTVNGSTFIYPAVYIGNQDYLNVFPDAHIGSFTFFDITTSEDIKDRNRVNTTLETTFSLILWFDFRKVYPANWQLQTTENVKAELLEFFRTNTFPNAKVRMSKIYDQAEDIYRNYTDKEIDDQFLMRPFGGFRMEGEIQYFEDPVCP